MKMIARATVAACLTLTCTPLAARAAPANCSALDPPRNAAHPAHNQQLLIPSAGVGLNALLFHAAGAGLHPTVLLMHGLPGNERNLDLAQALRRCGWNVLTFTYRGAWGSPGDFSIENAMEDTAAALAFARSAEAVKFGIDTRHLVLAGHSMGGATAMMTAAASKGLEGLILLDAWNIASDARSTPRSKLVAGLDDFGNSLHGASPESVADEILRRGASWDLAVAAAKLRGLPVLTVNARYGIGAANQPVTDALRKAGAQLSAVTIGSDHSFADHRMALAATVTRWLQRRAVRR